MTTPPNTPSPSGQPGQMPPGNGSPATGPQSGFPGPQPGFQGSPNVPYGASSTQPPGPQGPQLGFGGPPAGFQGSPNAPYGAQRPPQGPPQAQPYGAGPRPGGQQSPYGAPQPTMNGPLGAANPTLSATPSGYQPSEATQAKMKRRRRVVAIVLGLVVLLVAGGIGTYVYLDSTRTNKSSAAMLGLLTALQAGDADTALSHLDTSSYDLDAEPLLTSEALDGSFTFNSELQKIDSGDAYVYRAGIQVNGANRVVEWSVDEVDGQWLVDGADVLSAVLLDPELPYLINGVAIPASTSSVQVLPGHYTATSGMPLLIYAPTESSIDVYSGISMTLSPTPVVAEGVHQAVVDQTRAILSGCAAAKDVPTACGWELPFNNGVAKNGTITWTLVPDDPAGGLTLPTTGWTVTSGFTNYVTIDYETIAVGEGILDDGSEGYFDARPPDPRQNTFQVDLSGEAPVVTLA